jgi:hypothetical protein
MRTGRLYCSSIRSRISVSRSVPSSSVSRQAHLLEKIVAKIDNLCAQRDALKKELPGHMKGRVLGGRQW